MSARAVTRRAHAKINAFLRVVGRRDDGYHALESLILPVSLFDVVTAHSSDSLTLRVDGPLAGELPLGDDNLAMAAARALASATGIRAGAAIEIDKRIPVSAGLGGGSADAAATLDVLNELWECGLSAGSLASIGAAVGSDVPALLQGDSVFVSGRGERVQPVLAMTTWWVLAPLGFQVRAKDAYLWWDEEGSTGPDVGALIAAAEAGNDDLLGSALFNDLQAPVAARHPEIGEAIGALVNAGAIGAVMSGSGPTVVALAWNMGHADRVADAMPGSIVVSGPPSRSGPEGPMERPGAPGTTPSELPAG